MRAPAHRRPVSSIQKLQALLVGACALLPVVAAAQNSVSVPFTNGFIGNRSASAGTSNNVLTFSTLGIARIFFIQNSSTNAFEIQGNDIPGIMRIVRSNGTTLDLPASVNWRNSGGSTYLIGILPRPASPYTFSYAGGSIQITDGSVNGGTSVGGYVAAYTGSTLTNGASTSGNAALGQVRDGLNEYLATVLSSRPQGPVTVHPLATSNPTPTLTGNVTLRAGEQLTVTVNNVQYGTATAAAVSVSDGQWSLTLPSPLPNGTYDVVATVTNLDGFTLSDATSNELRIATILTLSGSFTANNKAYDGTTSATGTTTALSLQGVPDGATVTLAGVALAFQTATSGEARTVTISGVTLAGNNAGDYAVDLSSAPTATADITPRMLSIDGVSAVNRVYDGSTTATLTGTATYTNLVTSENFSVVGSPDAQFATATVGNNISVTVTGFLAPTANYAVTQPTVLASITPRALTIGGSFTATDKTYDGSSAAIISSNDLVLLGVVADDDVSPTQVVAQFASSDVGTARTVSIISVALLGDRAPNYTVSVVGAPTTTASIISAGPAMLTVGGTLVANSRVYDGTTTATGTVSGLVLQGIAPGHDVQIGSISLAFADASSGQDKLVQITGMTLTGSDSAAYELQLSDTPTATASITPRALTIAGVSVQSKEYDGTSSATLSGTPRYAGLVANESFAVAGLPSATFATPSVGAERAVTVLGFLAPSANYNLAQPAGVTGAILPRIVTVAGSFSASNKLFDGTTSVQLVQQSLIVLNAVSGELLELSNVLFAFATASVGSDKVVNVINATLTGATASNYTLSLADAPQTTASILAADPPAAPQSIAATEGDRQLTITWTAPADEGCATVNGWVVEYRTSGGAWMRVTLHSRLPMRTTIASLANNIAVDVRVAATNDCGTGLFAAVQSFTPIGPTTTDTGNGGGSRPPSLSPGQTRGSSGGQVLDVSTTIEHDTTMRLTGTSFSLALLAVDDGGATIPVDTPAVLQLEHGGKALTSGSGFAPGTIVTLYLYAHTGQPILLGRITVLPDGTFASTADVPALPEGNYTLQVNGINDAGTLRSVAVGVQVAPPPPDLVLTAVPNTNTPTVGDTVSITITVTNRGTGPAVDVVIPRAFREPGFEVVAALPQHGSYDTRSQSWHIPRIEAGASARLVLTALVQPPASEFLP